jgi:hypothetical protein
MDGVESEQDDCRAQEQEVEGALLESGGCFLRNLQRRLLTGRAGCGVGWGEV